MFFKYIIKRRYIHMEFTIRNEFVEATISSKAAEVISFKSIEENKELVWCRNPEHWYNCNPILFPIVGPVPDNKYTINGVQYTLTQHGFLRRSEFEFETVKKDSCTLSFKATDDSKALYPFDFKITVNYKVEGKKLLLSYTVENLDSTDLPFMIGFHPAFNNPSFNDADYNQFYIKFEQPEMVNGVLTDTMYLKDVINDKDRQIFFYDGVVKSNYVVLTNGKGGMKVSKEGYDVLGFWSKSEAAPFVCIEPQFPHNDLPKAHTFRNDTENNLLAPNKTFSCNYYWEIVD